MTPRRGLLAASVLALFSELLLIRWIPSAIHVVAFFTNLVLIASFLGLGIGMARRIEAEKAAWRGLWRLAIASGVVAALGLIRPTVDLGASPDYYLNELAAGVRVPSALILIGVFGLVVWAMIPFGQLVAAYFDQIPRIPAYSINIAGSLLGVAGFAAVSALGLPPSVWFGVTIALLLLYGVGARYLAPVVLIVVALAALYYDASNGLRNLVGWSPYYKVVASPVVSETGDLREGFVVDVNNQFLLSGLDLRPEARLPSSVPAAVIDSYDSLKSYYSLPFAFGTPERVLVLGSGAGNDVAAALRAGTEHVTAVDIDPLVIDLGKDYHPEAPYDAPQVTIVVDDGRSFLRESSEEFDLVLFATLDSHGLLSGASNIRMESFVYTEESIQAARDRVAPGGRLVLLFGAFREDVQYRQYATVRKVFSQDPVFLVHSSGQRAILAGSLAGVDTANIPPDWRVIGPDEIAAKLIEYPYAGNPATDDWPYLYLREPRIPREYIWTLIGILALSLVLVRANFRQAYRIDGHFFFLGAGFLLLETKSVTEYGLLIGSTWQTNAMVFSVILGVILVANLLVLKVLPRPPFRLLYGLIALTLVVQYLWPVASWVTGPGSLGYAAATLYLGAPIFLAAIVFAGSFRVALLGTAALASNLLGAVLGGTAEYLSLAWGIRSLTLLALAMYGASYVFWEVRRRLRPTEEPATLVEPEVVVG